MLTQIVAMSIALATAAMQAPTGQELSIGDKAPPLAAGEWVKGEPIKEFEPGKLYVVEFWATWCGPCKTSIPHLTKLQEKYQDDVAFIGVSIWEDQVSDVEPFVKEMGDKMGYRVATDSIPEGKTANDGAMAKNWMMASGESGIPTAFIVDKTGKIAWIGHPMSMDEPLAKVVAGEWNIEKAASERKASKSRELKLNRVMSKLQGAGSAKEAAAILPELESLMAEDEELAARLAGIKFSLLLATDENKAVAFAEEMAEKSYSNNAMMLNNMAWTLIDPESERKPGEKAIKAALKMSQKSNELTNMSEGGYLDTLALAYFLSGDPQKALELQEKAVKLAGDELDPSMKTRLEDYRKAVEEKK